MRGSIHDASVTTPSISSAKPWQGPERQSEKMFAMLNEDADAQTSFFYWLVDHFEKMDNLINQTTLKQNAFTRRKL